MNQQYLNLNTSMTSIFMMIEIAEEALKKNKLDKQEGAFLTLTPPCGFSRKSPELYRSHVNELVGRMKEREPLEPATDAEVLNVIMEAAERSPLRSHVVQAAERLFRKCMPSEIHEKLPALEERFPQEVTEFIEETRVKVGKLRGL